MSAVLKSPGEEGSWFDIDYLAGNALPRDKGIADVILSSYQRIWSLDTITGEVPPEVQLGRVSAQDYAKAIREWRQSKKGEIVWDLLEQAREGRPVDRVAPRSSFEPLQEWEGYVVSVDDGVFFARLLDITNNESIEREQAEFSFDDVSSDDLSLVEVGAVFRWSVGYEKRVNGSRQKISSIVFRRLPRWTSDELEAARVAAKNLVSSIAWE